MYTRQIVSYINNHLATAAFNGSAFQGGNLYGIALTAPKDMGAGNTHYLPFVMNGDNEQYVGLDDTYTFQLYHKNNGLAKQPVAVKDDYGDGRLENKRLTNMSMIFFGRYQGLRLSAEEIFDIIDKDFPETINAATKTILVGIRNAEMRIVSANFNALQILQQEYKLDKISIAPNDIVIQVNYQIECTYRKDCIITACCN